MNKLTDGATSSIKQRMETLAYERHKNKRLQPANLKQKRLANKEDAKASDWTVMQSTDLGGLKFWVDANPVRPLRGGERRFYMDVGELPAEVRAASRSATRRSCIQDSQGNARLECIWSEIPSSLHKTLDMGSASWSAQAVVFDSRRGCVHGTYNADPPHRRHRHHILSIEHANLREMMTEVHIVLNTGSAPYGRSGFFGTFSFGGKQFFDSFDETSVLFESKYPRLSHAMNKGKHDPEFGQARHKKKVFDWAKNCPLLGNRLEVSKEGRWYQIVSRSLDSLPHWPVLDLVGSYIATVSGWKTTYCVHADLPDMDVDSDADAEVQVPPVEPATPAQMAVSAPQTPITASSSSSSATGGNSSISAVTSPTPSGSASSVGIAVATRVVPQAVRQPTVPLGDNIAGARKQVSDTDPSTQRLRAHCANQLDMSFRTVGNSALQAAWTFVCHCTLPCRNENGEDLRNMKTQEGCSMRTWYMTQPESKCYIKKMFDVFEDADLLHEVGIFSAKLTSSWSLPPEHGNAALTYAFDYACSLAFRELLYCIQHSDTLPGMYGGLLQDRTRRGTLERLERFYGVWQRFNECVIADHSLEWYLELLVFPWLSWTLRVMVGLDEHEFKEVGDSVMALIEPWGRSQKTTKMIEDFFNFARGQCGPRSKQMRAERIQHCTTVCGLDAQYDRPITMATPEARLDAPTRLEPAAFRTSAAKSFSLGDRLLEDFIESPDSELSTDTFAECGLRWLAVQHADPHFEKLHKYWQSLLVERGDVVWKCPVSFDEPEGICIGATEVGLVLLPVRICRVGRTVFCKMSLPDFTCFYRVLHIDDAAQYRAVKVTDRVFLLSVVYFPAGVATVRVEPKVMIRRERRKCECEWNRRVRPTELPHSLPCQLHPARTPRSTHFTDARRLILRVAILGWFPIHVC